MTDDVAPAMTNTLRDRQRGRIPMWLLGIVGAIVALAGVEFYAIQKYGRVGAPPASVAAKSGTPAAAPAAEALAPIVPVALPAPEGWLDAPANESVVGTKLALTGWALAQGGVARVEVRVDDRVFQARYGTAREDVAKVEAGLPRQSLRRLHVRRRLRGSSADATRRHRRRDREERPRDRARAPQPDPARGDEPMEGAARRASRARAPAVLFPDDDLGRRPRRRARGRVAVRRLPLAHAEGRHVRCRSCTCARRRAAAATGPFDPDLRHQGHEMREPRGRRGHAERRHALRVEKHVPVQFILNGGIWGDASCETPDWDLTDHLEQDKRQLPVDRTGRGVLPTTTSRATPDRRESPQLARSLTYNVYAKRGARVQEAQPAGRRGPRRALHARASRSCSSASCSIPTPT